MLYSLARGGGLRLIAAIAKGLVTGREAINRRVPLPDRVPLPQAGRSGLAGFGDWLSGLEQGTLLELGTRRVTGMPSTTRADWAPRLRYIASDFQDGKDVDVVADIENLSATFDAGSIDAVVACSVFEHVRRPWLAAAEIGKVLRPGGRVYIQTHNCFPIHAHPFDYWRFTREALDFLFCDEHGFCRQETWYDFPAAVVSSQVPRGALSGAFLNVCLTAERR